jgi:competence protein ComEA
MRRAWARIAEIARASPSEVGLVAVLSAVVIASSILVYVRTREPPPPPLRKVSAATPSPEAKNLVVHVAGMVISPGVYDLPEGSRTKDAVDAAGGPAHEADLNALNLAALLVDGQKVLVPKQGEVASGGAAEEATEHQGKVNLNVATEAQLQELPGIGPVLADRIVAYRQRKQFTSTRQLLEVEGIGQKKYNSLKDLVTV